MKNRAFTMIEIIFVIVILGILASIAIPKLIVTRDDALVTKEISNAQTVKKDMINEYLVTDKDIALRSSDCFNFIVKNKILTVSKSVNNGAVYCQNVYDLNVTSNILKSQTLGGYKVKF